MRTNYVLIDYENVQPSLLPAVGNIPLKVFVFVGENQTKIPFDLANSLQSLGESAEYVKIEGNGINALDFHVAYFIGKLAEKDPKSYFHIVSKDKGFDPLLRYLKRCKIPAQRVAKFSDILILNSSQYATFSQKVNAVVLSLQTRGNSRPRRVETLKNTIHSFFMKTISDEEVLKIINSLKSSGVVSVEGLVVSYSFQNQ